MNEEYNQENSGQNPYMIQKSPYLSDQTTKPDEDPASQSAVVAGLDAGPQREIPKENSNFSQNQSRNIPPQRQRPPFIIEPMQDPAAATPLLECKNLSKYYIAGRPAIDNFNMTLYGGHIIGILGPNGSGKTTLLKMINGLLVPSGGSLLINGMAPGPESKAIVSYLPERTYLETQKTVGKLVDFFDDFYEDFDRERAFIMLQNLGIDTSSRLKTLSKGTKEKVQLILVMSRNASLYVLDEPIAGVDPAARDYILRTILTNYNPSATILICTHLIYDIESILDHFIFISKGCLVAEADTDRIREEFGMTVDTYFREVFSC